MSIVTAASGARDSYQIPIALYEAGLLAQHVTDFYTPDLLSGRLKLFPYVLSSKLAKRHVESLPSSKVHNSRLLASRQLLQRLVPPLRGRWQGDQESIGLSALRQAKRHQAALLMYAGYAYSAFKAEAYNARPRGLVQYHPHVRECADILRADIRRYPCLSESLDQIERDMLDQTNLPELEISNQIICASSFTAKTCVSLGISPGKVKIIPYGSPFVSLPPSGVDRLKSGPCSFLFVGSGIHRKGLHHLLLAWKHAKLSGSRLTIVSRRIDPQIRLNFDPGDNVSWLSSVNDSDLPAIYEASDVFVMPSLVEGFGYVYLEAMAHGCFCIGSPNTALPDLLTQSTGAGCIVPAAEPLLLAVALQDVEASALAGRLDRQTIALQASRFTWESFRMEIANVGRDLVGLASTEA